MSKCIHAPSFCIDCICNFSVFKMYFLFLVFRGWCFKGIAQCAIPDFDDGVSAVIMKFEQTKQVIKRKTKMCIRQTELKSHILKDK